MQLRILLSIAVILAELLLGHKMTDLSDQCMLLDG